MFTVKLMKDNTVTLVEAERVHIYPAGRPEAPGTEGQPAPSTNRVRGISVTLFGKMEVFHVGDDSEQIARDVVLYDCAFIENSEGATTERVYCRQ